jgi:hypothetical protein
VSLAWVLNVDADLELAVGNGYSPSKVVIAAMAEPVALLTKTLIGPNDVVLVQRAGSARIDKGTATHGRAFCPTPRAIALMHRAGVEPEPHPSFDVLRTVNGRQFCASIGQTLPGAAFARSLDDAVAIIAEPPPVGAQWRAKRAFGMAGRGQRPIAPGQPSAADASFLETSIAREGGIQIEPEVAIVRELAVHGLLGADGSLRLGFVLEQRCDATGQWLESRPIAEDVPLLRREADGVAAALHRAGYFGPFGVDAFEYDSKNGVTLNPRSEINARYSMGFSASGLLENRAPE